jgi:hypothetical protein
VPYFLDVFIRNDHRLEGAGEADGIQLEEMGRRSRKIGLDRMARFDVVTADKLPALWIKEDQLAVMTQDEPTCSIDPVDPIDTDF